jgi:pimeloyl-ACP methyl ester carboxylesterase
MAQTGYAPVKDLALYYEIHGQGKPLVLLHGGLGNGAMFGPVLAQLAQKRQVIAFDLQGHGRTADGEQALRYHTMADDLATALRQLGLEKADAMGYSLGGGVALRLAIQHPVLVDRLILVSTPFRQDGWYPEVVQAMAGVDASAAPMMAGSPMAQTYAAIAPRKQDFPRLLDKIGAMMRQPYDWTDDVAAMAAPTLLVFGDADSISPRHMAEFFALRGGGQADAGWDGANMGTSRLAVLPGHTHYDLFMAPLLVPVVESFLDPKPSRQWE